MRGSRVLWCALIGAGLVALAVELASGQAGRRVRGEPAVEQPAPPPPGEEVVAPPGPPPDATPEEIVEFCITTATEIADRHVEINASSAETGVATIGLLLEAGETAKAQEVARWCIHWINTHTQRGVDAIQQLCQRCTRLVIKAGGGRALVQQMRTACGEQVDRILASRGEAVDAVKAAIGEPEEEQTAGQE